MPAPVYADTNVFIRAFEGTDDLTTALIELLALRHGITPVFATSELTLAEILVHPLRDGNHQRRQRYEYLILPSDWLTVKPVDRDVLIGAAWLRSRYRLKLPDAIHVASALQLGCAAIISGDAGVVGRFSFGTTPYPFLATGEVEGHEMTLETVRQFISAARR